MVGVISHWDILAHPVVTIRAFGWRVFFRAVFTASISATALPINRFDSFGVNTKSAFMRVDSPF